MSSLLEDSAVGYNLVIWTRTASLDKYMFSFVSNMQKQWVERNLLLLDCAGSQFGQSVKASIEERELVVTNIDASALSNFETEEDTKEHVEKLKYWEQERCNLANDNYNKLKWYSSNVYQ